jgi:N-acetylglutamate synthase-like GNAT family acetyltransferase
MTELMPQKQRFAPCVGFPDPEDVDGIYALIELHAARGSLLTRGRETIRASLSEWIVAKHEGAVVACVSMHRYSQALAEVRSLAVHPDHKGCGLGTALLNTLNTIALQRSVKIIFAFTRAERFFQKNGFAALPATDRSPSTLWIPPERTPRPGQTIMVADARSRDPERPLPAAWGLFDCEQDSACARAENAGKSGSFESTHDAEDQCDEQAANLTPRRDYGSAWIFGRSGSRGPKEAAKEGRGPARLFY